MIRGDRAGVVQKPADQGRLAVIDGTAGQEAEQGPPRRGGCIGPVKRFGLGAAVLLGGGEVGGGRVEVHQK